MSLQSKLIERRLARATGNRQAADRAALSCIPELCKMAAQAEVNLSVEYSAGPREWSAEVTSPAKSECFTIRDTTLDIMVERTAAHLASILPPA